MTLWGKHPRHDQSISTLGSETMLKIGQARSQTQVLSLATLSLSYPFMTGTFMSSITELPFKVHRFKSFENHLWKSQWRTKYRNRAIFLSSLTVFIASICCYMVCLFFSSLNTEQISYLGFVSLIESDVNDRRWGSFNMIHKSCQRCASRKIYFKISIFYFIVV